jgi:hypothetical protein
MAKRPPSLRVKLLAEQKAKRLAEDIVCGTDSTANKVQKKMAKGLPSHKKKVAPKKTQKEPEKVVLDTLEETPDGTAGIMDESGPEASTSRGEKAKSTVNGKANMKLLELLRNIPSIVARKQAEQSTKRRRVTLKRKMEKKMENAMKTLNEEEDRIAMHRTRIVGELIERELLNRYGNIGEDITEDEAKKRLEQFPSIIKGLFDGRLALERSDAKL